MPSVEKGMLLYYTLLLHLCQIEPPSRDTIEFSVKASYLLVKTRPIMIP